MITSADDDKDDNDKDSDSESMATTITTDKRRHMRWVRARAFLTASVMLKRRARTHDKANSKARRHSVTVIKARRHVIKPVGTRHGRPCEATNIDGPPHRYSSFAEQ